MCFNIEELFAPRPTAKLEDHPLSAVRDCLLNIFAATSILEAVPPSGNLSTLHAMVTGTHLLQLRVILRYKIMQHHNNMQEKPPKNNKNGKQPIPQKS
jgi:hypothetical protein